MQHLGTLSIIGTCVVVCTPIGLKKASEPKAFDTVLIWGSGRDTPEGRVIPGGSALCQVISQSHPGHGSLACNIMMKLMDGISLWEIKWLLSTCFFLLQWVAVVSDMPAHTSSSEWHFSNYAIWAFYNTGASTSAWEPLFIEAILIREEICLGSFPCSELLLLSTLKTKTHPGDY